MDRTLFIDADDFFASDEMTWVMRARRLAKEQLAQIEGRATRAREQKEFRRFQQEMRKIGGVMRRFSKSLERGDRQATRRTRHAQTRRKNKKRPVDKAFEDARQATAEYSYLDDKEGTIVVSNGHGRIHVFSKSGRHVTSFTIKRDNLEHRIRTGKWRPIPEEKLAEFKATLQPHQGSDRNR